MQGLFRPSCLEAGSLATFGQRAFQVLNLVFGFTDPIERALCLYSVDIFTLFYGSRFSGFSVDRSR